MPLCCTINITISLVQLFGNSKHAFIQCHSYKLRGFELNNRLHFYKNQIQFELNKWVNKTTFISRQYNRQHFSVIIWNSHQTIILLQSTKLNSTNSCQPIVNGWVRTIYCSSLWNLLTKYSVEQKLWLSLLYVG